MDVDHLGGGELIRANGSFFHLFISFMVLTYMINTTPLPRFFSHMFDLCTWKSEARPIWTQ